MVVDVCYLSYRFAHMHMHNERSGLLEWELALNAILGAAVLTPTTLRAHPIFVGSVDDKGAVTKFNLFAADFYPDTSSKTNPLGSVRRTVELMFKQNGAHVNPQSLKNDVAALVPTLKS